MLLNAQHRIGKYQGQINGGFGFSPWGFTIYTGVDYAIHKDVTIGGEFNFRSYHENVADKANYKRILGISGNANYHFSNLFHLPRAFDLYIGLTSGAYFWTYTNIPSSKYKPGFNLHGQAGGRWFFNEKWGVNVEFNVGDAYYGGKYGLSYKIWTDRTKKNDIDEKNSKTKPVDNKTGS